MHEECKNAWTEINIDSDEKYQENVFAYGWEFLGQ